MRLVWKEQKRSDVETCKRTQANRPAHISMHRIFGQGPPDFLREIDVFGKCLAVLQLQPVFVVFSSIRIVVQSWLSQNPFGPLRINAHVGAGADQARQDKWNNIYKLLGVQRPCLSSSHTMRHSDTPQTPSVWDSQ